MIEISKDADSILSADQAGDIEITADGNTSNILNPLISSFEERVDGIMAALRVLANTQEVLSGDWLKIKPLLMIFIESYEGLAMYIEANGDHYTVQRDWTGLNLSDRGYFPILQSGHEVSGYRWQNTRERASRVRSAHEKASLQSLSLLEVMSKMHLICFFSPLQTRSLHSLRFLQLPQVTAFEIVIPFVVRGLRVLTDAF
jgi:hypothetical protein